MNKLFTLLAKLAIMGNMSKFGSWLHQQLYSPFRVLICCLSVAFFSLLFNGGLLNLYSLRRDFTHLNEQMDSVRAQTLELELQLKRARDPSYIEHQALDRYDLVEENDLVFVFADE